MENEIYKKNLSKNQKMLMILFRILPVKELCKLIITLKNKYEIYDINKYYNERLKNIYKKHYHIHEHHENKFSYIFNSTKYVIKKDYDLSFYDRTGISYQIIELIHHLIKIKNEPLIKNNKEYKEWLNYDDKLYSQLSIKIMEKMSN